MPSDYWLGAEVVTKGKGRFLVVYIFEEIWKTNYERQQLKYKERYVFSLQFEQRVLKMVDVGASTLPTLTVGILERMKQIWDKKKYFNRALIMFIIFSVMVHHAWLLVYILLKIFNSRYNTDSSCITYKFIKNQLGYIEDWKLKHTITTKSLIFPINIFMCVFSHSVPVITTLKNLFYALFSYAFMLFSPRMWKKEISGLFKM